MRTWILLVGLMGSNVWASYRVHLLKIEMFDARGKKVGERTEVSTLDSVQYEQYHAGAGALRTTLIDTWYCPGDTSRRKLCEKPKVAPKQGTLPYHLQPVIP